MAWREPLSLAAIVAFGQASPACAQRVVGEWHGALSFGASGLPVEVSVTADADGKLSGSWRSPEQRQEPLALDKMSFAASSFSFDVPGDVARFSATWDQARQAWVGTWSQVVAVPLVLLPGKLATVPRP